MSLLIDDREPTDLRRHLSSYDLSIEICRLDFGDAFFEGSGPNDSPVLIGIERKRLGGLIDDIESRRLAGYQFPGMYKTYNYFYLIVEGLWRPSPSGAVEILEGKAWVPLLHKQSTVLYRQIDSYLDSLATSDPRVVVWRTADIKETAAVYASRYHHWQKPWSKRHSRDVIYAPPPPYPGKKAQFREPNMIHRILAQFPGLDRRAWAIGDKFSTPEKFFEFAVSADEKAWAKLPGIGKTGARNILDVLAGKKS